jgi:hypothetical protein
VSFTVVPIHNLNLPSGTVIPFGKFTIQDVPEWLLKEPILNSLSEQDRDGVHRAKQALVSKYEADAYGFELSSAPSPHACRPLSKELRAPGIQTSSGNASVLMHYSPSITKHRQLRSEPPSGTCVAG